jgi:potassium/hydrogen antiporter
MQIHIITVIASLLLFFGILLSQFSSKMGIPTLLAFLTLGLSFGNGGQYDFTYDYPQTTYYIAQYALCMILFFGGLNTDFKKTRQILGQGLMLSTLGVLLTTIFAAILIHYGTFLDWHQSLLLGAIISSTDAAAVFSILEAKQLKLKENISSVLELESGTNDPMAYFLTISLTQFIQVKELAVGSIAFGFLYNMLLGILIGVLMGYGMYYILKTGNLKIGQKPVVILAMMFFTFSLAEIVHGNSFLAIFIAGIILGNLGLNVAYIINYFQQFAWLMEILLFTILGLQVFIQDLPRVFWVGILVSAILIFVARPLAVFVSLAFFKTSIQKKTYIAWVGLRGATPIVFALIPVLAHIPSAKSIFDITFFVVLTSILLQGSTLSFVANWLKLSKN